ncbi:MAG: hypothetical protein KA988_05320 [Longilinea sp.]|nr:hypothetical protein [Longilinea sp.]
MKTHFLFKVWVIGMALSLLLTACQGSGTSNKTFEPLIVQAANCDYGGKIRSIEAIDALTVRFTLCSPDAAFLAKVASPAFSIQDRDTLDQYQGDALKISQNVNGTGPYVVKLWVPGDRLELQANPNYWDVPARNQEMLLRWASSSNVRLGELRFGKVDGADNLNAASLSEQLSGDNTYRVYQRPALNLAYLGMNRNIAPFDDVRVRQAFSLALGRRSIVNQTFPLGSLLAEQIVPPSMQPGYTDGLRWYDYNPKEAEDLLKEAGFDFNQEIELTYPYVPPTVMPDNEKVAQLIQEQLKLVNVKVRLNRSRNFETLLQQGKLALFLYGFEAEYSDPTAFYDTYLGSSSTLFGDPHPELVTLIQQANNTVDATARQVSYNAVNEKVKELSPFVPLAHVNSLLAFRGDVLGVRIGPLNENFEQMSAARDQLVFIGSETPKTLWPVDEVNEDALRAASLLYTPLVRYQYGETGVRPGLAEYWTVNSDLTEWTFYLRYNVRFSNGATLDANDVVATFAAQWDASNPNHVGLRGEFPYFKKFFGAFLNAK